MQQAGIREPHATANGLRHGFGVAANSARVPLTLAPRAPGDRGGIEPAYIPSLAVVEPANAGVPGLAGQTPERWYQAYVSQVEGLCGVG